MPGHEHHHPPADTAKGKCAFADLAQVMTGGADAVLVAAAVAFILALALLVAVRPTLRAATYLRPPLRGPPLAA